MTTSTKTEWRKWGILALIVVVVVAVGLGVGLAKKKQPTKLVQINNNNMGTTTLFPQTTTFLPELIKTTSAYNTEISNTTTTSMVPETITTTSMVPETITTTSISPSIQASMNLTYTNIGSVAVSTAQKIIGNYSLYLPGSSDNRLVISNFPGSTYLSGDWTIEFFLYLPNPNNMESAEMSPISFTNEPNTTATMLIYPAYYRSGNILEWYVGRSSSVTWNIANREFSSNPNTEAWNHVAICYTLNSNYKFFLNGKLAGTSNVVDNVGPLLTNINLGSFGIVNQHVIGGFNTYVDGLRISNVARYSADYTIPTSETYTADNNTIYFNSFEGTFAP